MHFSSSCTFSWLRHKGKCTGWLLQDLITDTMTMAQEISDLPSWMGALWVAHASAPLMAVVDGNEHEGGSGRRAGWLAGDSSLAVHGKVWCEAEGAPWRSVKGGK